MGKGPTGMTPVEIQEIKEAFGLNGVGVARVMGVSLITVKRWETHAPTGLHLEVLQVLHHVALELKRCTDETVRARTIGLVKLGVSAIVLGALTLDC